ncbi:hypothetical protein [Marinobacter sp. AC-23]|uniref:hypothetical protein n=1 Tax=Marinobacter sp. AC-23 TaxID=1879031 RepID=UPI0020C84F71|nr:hypothetical protein [Marinobacter sp. AC-23]
MPAWALLVMQFVVTAAAVFFVLWGFWGVVVRPYLDRKVAELVAATEEIEPRVALGVKKGVAETFESYLKVLWMAP